MSKTLRRILLTAMVAIVVGGLLCSSGFASPATARYTLIDLGTLGGTYSYAAAINNLGQVAGYSYTAGTSASTMRAFRTAPNAVINPATDNLGTLGGSQSAAYAIKDLGQVAGDSYLPNSLSHAFRTAPNAAINPATDDLGTLGGNNSYAHAINDLGEVAGNSFLSGFILPRAFRTGPNAPINPATDNLGTLGGNESGAFGINNNGQVVGYSFIPGNSIIHAFRTTGRTSIDPSTNDIGIAVDNHSGAYDINDDGQVTGFAYFAGATQGRGFVSGPNVPIDPLTDDMGPYPGITASSPRGINAQGLVVGFWSTASEELYRAFLYDGASMVDLNEVLDGSGTGWTLHVANDINDHGQIVGYGTIRGVTRAFRLDPIPEPSASALAFCGAITAGITRKRR